jgi:ketosteroid isomerase-like protein
MSERNVELMRRFTEAWNSRDIEAISACCDTSIELHSIFAAVGGGVYHGHDGLRTYQRDLEDAWGDEIRAEVEAFFDLGEQTLTFYAMHGRGQRSGTEVKMPIAVVVRWRDGLLVYFKGYTDREEALRELGVSADELEPIAP